MDAPTDAHERNANHKDCKVGEVVAGACHNVSIHRCLTSHCCPPCILARGEHGACFVHAWWLYKIDVTVAKS